MSTEVALRSVLRVKKVLHQTKWVQDCRQTLSVPLHSPPTIQIGNKRKIAKQQPKHPQFNDYSDSLSNG